MSTPEGIPAPLGEFVCVTCGAPFASMNALKGHQVKHRAKDGPAQTDPEAVRDGEAAPTSWAADEPPAPGRPKRSVMSWLKGQRKGAPATPVDPNVPQRAKPPKPKGRAPKRYSSAELLGDAWSFAGDMMMRVDFPVGNVLRLQAPMAGPILDEAVSGTIVDRLLQPVVREVDRWAPVGDLIGLPMAVLIAERTSFIGPDGRPNMTPVAQRMVRKAVRRNIKPLVAALKRERAQEKELAEALAEVIDGEMFADLGIEATADPIGAIIAMIFTPPADLLAEMQARAEAAARAAQATQAEVVSDIA